MTYAKDTSVPVARSRGEIITKASGDKFMSTTETEGVYLDRASLMARLEVVENENAMLREQVRVLEQQFITATTGEAEAEASKVEAGELALKAIEKAAAEMNAMKELCAQQRAEIDENDAATKKLVERAVEMTGSWVLTMSDLRTRAQLIAAIFGGA